MSKPQGLEQKYLDLIQQTLRNGIDRKHQVYFFGSRAFGGYKKYSDLDLWIECQPPLSRKELMKLREDFEESDLPIQIDLVTPETCLEAYKERIQNEKVIWSENEL